MKRIVDLVVSLAGLIALSPLMAVLALMVRMTSPGPAIFVQERVGLREQSFACCKFRTMSIGAPVAGTHEVSKAWQTGVGRWLRSTKLDELPQLWNVLKGEMSLVGPRPCLPSQADVIAARRRKDVFAIRPGITGLAQVRGIDMSQPEELADADGEYLQTRSFKLDLWLVMKTVLPRRISNNRGGSVS